MRSLVLRLATQGSLLFSGCASSQPAVVQRVTAAQLEARPWAADSAVFECQPPDAEVSLDGVPQGTCADFSGAPRGLTMGKGMHRIDVKKQGFSPYQTFITADGTRARLRVELNAVGGHTP